MTTFAIVVALNHKKNNPWLNYLWSTLFSSDCPSQTCPQVQCQGNTRAHRTVIRLTNQSLLQLPHLFFHGNEMTPGIQPGDTHRLLPRCPAVACHHWSILGRRGIPGLRWIVSISSTYPHGYRSQMGFSHLQFKTHPPYTFMYLAQRTQITLTQYKHKTDRPEPVDCHKRQSFVRLMIGYAKWWAPASLRSFTSTTLLQNMTFSIHLETKHSQFAKLNLSHKFSFLAF